jgi:hypothetical protein
MSNRAIANSAIFQLAPASNLKEDNGLKMCCRQHLAAEQN